MRELAEADPARGVTLDSRVATSMLETVLATPVSERALMRVRRRRAPRTALALLACATLGGGLAAAGVIHFGAPATSEQRLGGAWEGLGALAPGTAQVLPLRVGDPAGGPPWGLRVIGTTRGAGCVEFGRVERGQLGVLGQDGAFADDGRFHPLPVGDLTNAACANLDANGRLFQTASDEEVPASAWRGKAACLVPGPPGSSIEGARPSDYCLGSEIRSVYFGLLGPDATSLTYRLGGRTRTIRPSGPQGAYLIVAPRQHRGGYFQMLHSVLPLFWSSPIETIAYRGGYACHVAATPIGKRGSMCRPVGFRPIAVHPPSRAEVAAPIATRMVQMTLGHGHRVRGLRISFVAKVAVARASSFYEMTEDTSSPLAVFSETKRDIAAGEVVSFTVPAEKPGVYSGTIRLGLGGAVPFPVYSYAPGPLVGRFEVRLP